MGNKLVDCDVNGCPFHGLFYVCLFLLNSQEQLTLFPLSFNLFPPQWQRRSQTVCITKHVNVCLNMNSLFYLNSLFGHLVYCKTSEKGTSCCIEIQWDAHLTRGWLFGESPTARHLYNQILNKRLAIDVTSLQNWCFHCCVGELFENWSCSCRIVLKFGLFNETANHFIEL